MWGSISWTLRSWPLPKSRVRCLASWTTQVPLICIQTYSCSSPICWRDSLCCIVLLSLLCQRFVDWVYGGFMWVVSFLSLYKHCYKPWQDQIAREVWCVPWPRVLSRQLGASVVFLAEPLERTKQLSWFACWSANQIFKRYWMVRNLSFLLMGSWKKIWPQNSHTVSKVCFLPWIFNTCLFIPLLNLLHKHHLHPKKAFLSCFFV